MPASETQPALRWSPWLGFRGGDGRCRRAPAQAAALLHAPFRTPLVLDELQRLALRLGLAVVEALAVFAADRAQKAGVILRLDAFRHHLLAELVRKAMIERRISGVEPLSPLSRTASDRP